MKNQGKVKDGPDGEKPASVKKNNIISIKRRDAIAMSANNESVHMASSKGL